MTSLKPRFAVVGAGVVGLSCALALARRGARVRLFDGASAGSGVSTKAAGMLGFGFELARQPDAPLFKLGKLSLDLWPDFVREIEGLAHAGIGYDVSGTLACALDDSESEALALAAEACAREGVPVELLDGAQARVREPALAREPFAAVWFPDGQVDPVLLVEALKAAFVAVGGEIREGVAITEIRLEAAPLVDGESWDGVILATGAAAPPRFVAASGEIISSGLPDIGVVRGDMLALQAGVGAPRHVVRSGSLYVVPKSRWTLIGGVPREGASTSDRERLDDLRASAAYLLGRLALAEEIVHWSGLRPMVSDGAPIIGPIAGPGVYAAVGLYRHGVLLAPATAELIAGMAFDGSRVDLARAFSAERFFCSTGQSPSM